VDVSLVSDASALLDVLLNRGAGLLRKGRIPLTGL